VRELDNHLVLTKQVVGEINLTDRFSKEDLTAIGQMVWEGYERDEQSRAAWLRRMQSAMDLAMQLQTAKSFPFPDCANVKFPLVTIAAMQWHARAYPVLLNSPDLVKCRVLGPDPDGKKKDRAERISAHMSYQFLEEDEGWEEQHDRGLLSLSIVGTIFKKTYFDADKEHNVSELVQAKDLVMNYFARSTEDCRRKTHIFTMWRNEIYSRIQLKMFRDVSGEAWYNSPPPRTDPPAQNYRSEVRTGTSPTTSPDDLTPYYVLEQHVDLDLDGDGYAEPYVVTIERESKCVLRIVTRFEYNQIDFDKSGKRIVSIRSLEYFTKYCFIPSPDGGVYDIGFGILLGPLNESVNGAINLIFDGAIVATSAGGFLGRGVKLRGGQYSFRPFSWDRVDSTGEELSKGIFPLPVREPPAVLFQLLTLLIEYTNRISGATDVNVGENPGQNTPKYNMQAMLQEGQKVYSSIFKRQWRAMKQEFKKAWIINSFFLPRETTRTNAGVEIAREDYAGDSRAIVPGADPNLVSSGEKLQQAGMVKQSAMMTPGYNRDEVERRFLRALGITQIAEVFPGADKVPPLPQPKVEIEKLKVQQKHQDNQIRVLEKVLDLQEAAKKQAAEIRKLGAETLKILSEVGTEKQRANIEQFAAQVDAITQMDEATRANIDQVIQQLMPAAAGKEGEGGKEGGNEPGGMGGMAGKPANAPMAQGGVPA